MPADLPKTLLKALLALLKHQAKQWLGQEALGLAAQTLLDEELQTRLDAWLTQEETTRRLLQAAERAHRWLQDPHNCPNDDLRALFRDLPFGDLPTVQQALADLPQAMDAATLTQALDSALARDLPTLPAAQRAAEIADSVLELGWPKRTRQPASRQPERRTKKRLEMAHVLKGSPSSLDISSMLS